MEQIGQVSFEIPEEDMEYIEDNLFNQDSTHFQRILPGKVKYMQ